MIALILLAGVLTLAFSNGANDCFKGVATLHGAGTLGRGRALALAVSATALGGLASLLVAGALARAFSARGLVPDAVLDERLLASVAAAAALTVLLATRLALPISTTHALVGALAGAGWAAAGADLNLAGLGHSFALPLLASPVLATALTLAGLAAGRRGSRKLGLTSETCVCVGTEWVPVQIAGLSPLAEAGPASPVGGERLRLAVANREECQQRYRGKLMGVSAQSAITGTHLMSGALVSFARGLNDTPKMVGLLLGASVVSPAQATLSITVAMSLGGLLAGRRVAETLSRKISPMTPAQGLVGNLTTSLLVIGASRLGLPLSTTHVSTGAIFGIGADSRKLSRPVAGGILAAWLFTLPLAAALGAGLLQWLP
ncbi:MAG: anion permease [Myxococcota bacterium]